MSIGFSGSFSALGATVGSKGAAAGAGGGGGGSFLNFDLYDNFNSFRSSMQGRKTTWASSGTNYQYSTDAGDTYISDAQSDMYDGGNYTQLRKDGNSSNNLGYNSSTQTWNSIKYQGLGYSWPLVAIAVAPKDSTTRYGWSRSGNLGADGGGGSPNAITVYDGDTVQGFDLVYAWLVNKAYNQSSDPGVSHLYCTVGTTRWGGAVQNGFSYTDYSSSSDSDYSQYESTSTNCFVWTALVSKGQTNGYIDQGQARTFVNNFLEDAAEFLGV